MSIISFREKAKILKGKERKDSIEIFYVRKGLGAILKSLLEGKEGSLINVNNLRFERKIYYLQRGREVLGGRKIQIKGED